MSVSCTPFRPAAVLVTGGAGFIGTNLVRWMLSNTHDVSVINYDLLTYAAHRHGVNSLRGHGVDRNDRYYFIRGDVCDRDAFAAVLAGDALEPQSGRRIPRPDAVIHLAAETHVDRSIQRPQDFVSTNVVGTFTVLDSVRAELQDCPREFRLLNVSTDEVYGSLAPGESGFTEESPLAPNSPYSASKAGADCLARSYVQTFGLPVIITRSSNNYGPYQFPEKLIPLMISRAVSGKSLPVYGDGLHVRDWLHVEDHVRGLWLALSTGAPGEVFNFGGNEEVANVDLVRRLLDAMGLPHSRIEYVTDRPGHDRRYAMDIAKSSRVLGWYPQRALYDGLVATADWYRTEFHQ